MVRWIWLVDTCTWLLYTSMQVETGSVHVYYAPVKSLCLRSFCYMYCMLILWCSLITTFSDVCLISYLVAAAGLQCVWSLSLAAVDIYALLVRRSLQNHRVVSFFTVGDGVRFLRANNCRQVQIVSGHISTTSDRLSNRGGHYCILGSSNNVLNGLPAVSLWDCW